MKLHIGANGKPAPCKADEGACPLGENTIHGDFDSVADATGWAEEFHAKKAGGTFGSGLSKAPKVNLTAQANKEAVYQAVSDQWDNFGVESGEFYFQDFRAGQDLPFSGIENLNSGFHEIARQRLKEAYYEAARRYVDDISDGEAEAAGFVENYSGEAEYEVMDDAIYKFIEDDYHYDSTTGKNTMTAVGIVSLYKDVHSFNGNQTEKRDLPLKPIAKEYILNKEYDDANYAEPSNILKVISSENAKVEVTATSFPVDGKRESDWGSFKVDGVEFSYESKRDKVWISVGSGSKAYEFSFEESGDGYGLKDNLETVIENAKGIQKFAQTGRTTSEFTRRLERTGGNL